MGGALNDKRRIHLLNPVGVRSAGLLLFSEIKNALTGLSVGPSGPCHVVDGLFYKNKRGEPLGCVF
jgi:hypothetical protein